LESGKYGDMNIEESAVLFWARMVCRSMEDRTEQDYVRGRQIMEDEATLDRTMVDLKNIIIEKGVQEDKEDLNEQRVSQQYMEMDDKKIADMGLEQESQEDYEVQNDYERGVAKIEERSGNMLEGEL